MKGYGPALLVAIVILACFGIYAYQEWEEFDPLKQKSIAKSKAIIKEINEDPVMIRLDTAIERYAPLLVDVSCGSVMSFEKLASSDRDYVFEHFDYIYKRAKELNTQGCKLKTRPEVLPYKAS